MTTCWSDIEREPEGPALPLRDAARLLNVSVGYLECDLAQRKWGRPRGRRTPPGLIGRKDLLAFRARVAGHGKGQGDGRGRG